MLSRDNGLRYRSTILHSMSIHVDGTHLNDICPRTTGRPASRLASPASGRTAAAAPRSRTPAAHPTPPPHCENRRVAACAAACPATEHPPHTSRHRDPHRQPVGDTTPPTARRPRPGIRTAGTRAHEPHPRSSATPVAVISERQLPTPRAQVTEAGRAHDAPTSANGTAPAHGSDPRPTVESRCLVRSCRVRPGCHLLSGRQADANL